VYTKPPADHAEHHDAGGENGPHKEGLTIPEIHPGTYCGAQEHVAHQSPIIIYVDGNPLHEVAMEPEFEKMEEFKSEEFPF
jgi:hypothetical protein